jgi:mannose/fructose/N-acetylgalactosamine-specific phosphotransferase system component IIB
VVDEKASKDDMIKSVLKMSCPPGTKLSVLGAEKAAANLLRNMYDNDKVFIVCKSPKAIVDLWNFGFHVEKVTVGNMAGGTNKEKITKNISVTKEDRDDFRALKDLAVALYSQMVPSDVPTPFI